MSNKFGRCQVDRYEIQSVSSINVSLSEEQYWEEWEIHSACLQQIVGEQKIK